jgi:hypothetical protein
MANITKKDIRDAVNGQVEKEFINSAVKRVKKVQMDWYKKLDEIQDMCPWCNEQRVFKNPRNIIEIDGEPWLDLVCPECKNEVYCHLQMHEVGDMFSGYSYESTVTMKKGREKKPEHGFSLKIAGK